MRFIIIRSQKGVATLVALLMIGMLLLIGLAALSISDDEMTLAGNVMQDARAFHAAEAGLERASAEIQTAYDSTSTPPSPLPSGTEEINDCQVEYWVDDGGPVELRPLTVGALAGLQAQVKQFVVVSRAISMVDKAKTEITVNFESALIPIFQFAVFYGKDLEIAPGPTMTLIGRVHSNGNMYVQANSGLRMNSYVTASGNIYHGRKGAGGVSSGDVLIKDAHGNYVSMKDGGGWLDANSANWYDESVARWGGRVQDASHGQGELNLPLTNSDNPHAIIERGDSNPDSYEHKATLVIKDGQALLKQSNGTWSDVTAAMTADGTLTYTSNKFYDQREGDWVDCTDLDIRKMYDNGYAPPNGVVYFADEFTGPTFPAIRIKNGAELDNGLTIASNNPLYTLGDYNSINKKPASLMADAVSFLSNSWDDGLSTSSKYSRIATTTVVNACYLTGNTETTASNYNGGFENLPRFLEVWSGTKFTWSGSAVNLWNSTQADGLWSGTYYSPPIRDWSYDTALDDPANLPPETPMIRVFQRTGWQQRYIGNTEIAGTTEIL